MKEEAKSFFQKNPQQLEFMMKLRNKIPVDKKEIFEYKFKWSHLKQKNVLPFKV